MTKYVYHFREGNAQMRNLLGGKGANLAEMTRLGMPIPQGFTVTTEACNDYYANGGSISDEIKGQIDEALAALEAETGKKLDKDRFRRDLGGVEDAYAEIMQRLVEHDDN